MSLRFETIRALAVGGPMTLARLQAETKATREAVRYHLDDSMEIERAGTKFGAQIVYRLIGDEREGVDLAEEFVLRYSIERYALRRDVIAALTTGPHSRTELEEELDSMDHTISRDHMNRVIRELSSDGIAKKDEDGFDLTPLGYDIARRLWPS